MAYSGEQFTLREVDNIISVTGVSGAAVTATLPAVPGGFHHIVSIHIVEYAAAIVIASATPTVVTTTNIPGALAFTFPTALAAGTNFALVYSPGSSPIQSVARGVATTFVCPAIANLIWRINILYYVDL